MSQVKQKPAFTQDSSANPACRRQLKSQLLLQ